MQLFKVYTLKNGETVVFDGISMYEYFNGAPIDIYTSSKCHGAWDKRGRYLTNVYFEELENNKEMDIKR